MPHCSGSGGADHHPPNPGPSGGGGGATMAAEGAARPRAGGDRPTRPPAAGPDHRQGWASAGVLLLQCSPAPSAGRPGLEAQPGGRVPRLAAGPGQPIQQLTSGARAGHHHHRGPRPGDPLQLLPGAIRGQGIWQEAGAHRISARLSALIISSVISLSSFLCLVAICLSAHFSHIAKSFLYIVSPSTSLGPEALRP